MLLDGAFVKKRVCIFALLSQALVQGVLDYSLKIDVLYEAATKAKRTGREDEPAALSFMVSHVCCVGAFYRLIRSARQHLYVIRRAATIIASSSGHNHTVGCRCAVGDIYLPPARGSVEPVLPDQISVSQARAFKEMMFSNFYSIGRRRRDG